MSTPAIIYLSITLVGLGICIEQHGRPYLSTDRRNAWYSVVGVAIQMSLLYWGGFFAVTP